MKKDTYYFSHDFNAHNDVKILFLRQQLGMEGYGIYWFLIESLADSGGIMPLKIVPVLAMQMHIQEIKVMAVITEFELFIVQDEQFFSSRLLNHFIKRNELKELNSQKGKISAEKRKNSTEFQPQLNRSSTKEKKEKEKKENEIEIIYPYGYDFKTKWDEWLDYKKKEHKFTYKLKKTEQTALKQLEELSNFNEQNAIQIINQSIANGWKGFFKLQNQNNERTKTRNQQTNESLDYIKQRGQELYESLKRRTTNN